MLGYNELYELMRKEKYTDALQPLPKKFLEEYKEYIEEQHETSTTSSDLFSDSIAKSKKQLENAISIFRELMLKRKKKILNLVFIATETGIMKKDYENMLLSEKEVFEKMVQIFEEGDKEITKTLSNEQPKKTAQNKMILFEQNTDQFMDHSGAFIGPFKSGDLVNIDSEIANILVTEGKASFVDES